MCVKNHAGNPLVVEFKTVIRRQDDSVKVIERGTVIGGGDEFFVVEIEDTENFVTIPRSRVIDSNVGYPDSCKFRKFCY